MAKFRNLIMVLFSLFSYFSFSVLLATKYITYSLQNIVTTAAMKDQEIEDLD